MSTTWPRDVDDVLGTHKAEERPMGYPQNSGSVRSSGSDGSELPSLSRVDTVGRDGGNSHGEPRTQATGGAGRTALDAPRGSTRDPA